MKVTERSKIHCIAVWALQVLNLLSMSLIDSKASDTAADYVRQLNAIERDFGYEPLEYLAKGLHPVNWCIFTNGRDAEKQLKSIEDIFKGFRIGQADVFVGKPSPLFGVRTTNSSEGNNGLLLADVRQAVPFMAIRIYVVGLARDLRTPSSCIPLA